MGNETREVNSGQVPRTLIPCSYVTGNHERFQTKEGQDHTSDQR